MILKSKAVRMVVETLCVIIQVAREIHVSEGAVSA